jgi:hypothetical protein
VRRRSAPLHPLLLVGKLLLLLLLLLLLQRRHLQLLPPMRPHLAAVLRGRLVCC